MDKNFLKKEPYSFYQDIEKELKEKNHQEIALDHHVSQSLVTCWNQAVVMKNRFLDDDLSVEELKQVKKGRPSVSVTEDLINEILRELKTMTWREVADTHHVSISTIRRWAGCAGKPATGMGQKEKNREEVENFVSGVICSVEKYGIRKTQKKYGMGKSRLYLILRMWRALGRI